jgi:putative SOS response-associated peptidase YedK
MCGRFTRKYTWREVVELYRLTSPPSNLQPRYNVCPTDTIDTVVERDGKRELVPMRWGLIPAWWQKPLKEMKLATFNARAETVTQKPMFREAFKQNRCPIPASGYYEWEDTPAGKQPHYFSRRDGHVVTIASIWDR